MRSISEAKFILPKAVLLFFCGLILPICSDVLGQSSANGGSFLPLGHGAKVFGQGGSSIVLLKDDTATYWNPAKLPYLSDRGMTIAHSNLISGVKIGYSSLSFGTAFGSKVPASVWVPSQPDDPKRHAIGFFYSHLGLELSQGSTWSENILGVSYGVALNNYVTLGTSLKLLGSSSKWANAMGASIDFGFYSVLKERVDFAVVCKDGISYISWDTGAEDKLPITTTIGIAYLYSKSVVGELNLILQDTLVSEYSLGGSAKIAGDMVQLRGGVNLFLQGEKRVVPVSGFGVIYKTISLDYGVHFDSRNVFGNVHSFSLTVAFR